MTTDNPLLFFLSALGIFNGLIASFYFLFITKNKKLSNYFLGVLLLLLSIRIGKSFLLIFYRPILKIILQIGLSSCFLIGPALYFYLKTVLENKKKITKNWIIHILILVVIIISMGILYPYNTENRDFWNRYFVKFIYWVWIIYILISGYVLKDVFRKLFYKTSKILAIEKWLISIYIGNFLICAAYMIGYFFMYYIGPLSFSMVFYGLVFFLIFEKNRNTIFQDIPKKYSDKKIDIKEVEKLKIQLRSIMLSEKPFKNSNIKLNDIAKKLKISSHLFSQLLNDNLGKNFKTFINEYRINEAKKLLVNNKFTLEAIGYDAGFSSKSNFYSTFKKFTGKTPSDFQKSISN